MRSSCSTAFRADGLLRCLNEHRSPCEILRIACAGQSHVLWIAAVIIGADLGGGLSANRSPAIPVGFAPESRRGGRRRAWERRATCGLIAPQQTKPLFDNLVRAAEQRERETTVTSGHATLATRGHYPLLGPDFHRLDGTSLRLVHSLDYLVGERA
jgi:hypothetical protein